MKAATEPQSIGVDSSTKSVGQLQRRGRALIGWMNPDEARLSLAGRKVDQRDHQEYVQRVEQARAAVASRPPGIDQTNVVSVVPDALSDHVEALRQHQSSAPYFNEGWRVAVVDLSKVCAAQPSIFSDQAVERVVGVDEDSIVSLATVALPIPTPSTHAAQFDPIKQAWVFSSPDPNLRISGQFGRPIQPGVNAFGFVVAVAASMLQVISYHGRYLLRDGYHRAYGFLSRGITRVPALVREVATFDALGLPMGLLPQDAFLGDRPPLLVDYLNDEVAADVVMPVTQKAIIIQALELNTLG